MIKYIALFLLTCVLDYGWGLYISAVSNKQPFRASIYSALIYATGSILTIFTIEDHWVIMSAIAGTMLGTYFSVKKENKNAQE